MSPCGALLFMQVAQQCSGSCGLQVIADFRNLTGGDPDAVIFSSAYWDLGRYHVIDPTILQSEELEESIIQRWQSDFGEVLDYLRVSSLLWASRDIAALSCPTGWHTSHADHVPVFYRMLRDMQLPELR